MKKILVLILGIVGLCFLIPILGTIKFETKSTISEVENKLESSKDIINEESYDYKEYNTIKLLHSTTNEIEEIPLDEYLYGVVASEMPADFENEALKAQAVVARTYTFYKIANNDLKHGEANLCDNSSCCQAWITKENRLARWEESKRDENWNKIISAVNSTKGQIITYEGKPINAFFHSNSGGITEIPINVWGGSGYPYLQVIETSGEDVYSQYASEVEIPYNEVIEKIKNTHSDIQIDFSLEDAIKILDYTDSGRIKTVKFGNVNLSGVEARTIFGLKSTNFTISMFDEKVKFTVKGYGHGVGMSQTGADSLARQGKNYQEIIKHFYKDVEIIQY